MARQEICFAAQEDVTHKKALLNGEKNENLEFWEHKINDAKTSVRMDGNRIALDHLRIEGEISNKNKEIITKTRNEAPKLLNCLSKVGDRLGKQEKELEKTLESDAYSETERKLMRHAHQTARESFGDLIDSTNSAFALSKQKALLSELKDSTKHMGDEKEQCKLTNLFSQLNETQNTIKEGIKKTAMRAQHRAATSANLLVETIQEKDSKVLNVPQCRKAIETISQCAMLLNGNDDDINQGLELVDQMSQEMDKLDSMHANKAICLSPESRNTAQRARGSLYYAKLIGIGALAVLGLPILVLYALISR